MKHTEQHTSDERRKVTCGKLLIYLL